MENWPRLGSPADAVAAAQVRLAAVRRGGAGRARGQPAAPQPGPGAARGLLHRLRRLPHPREAPSHRLPQPLQESVRPLFYFGGFLVLLRPAWSDETGTATSMLHLLRVTLIRT